MEECLILVTDLSLPQDKSLKECLILVTDLSLPQDKSLNRAWPDYVTS